MPWSHPWTSKWAKNLWNKDITNRRQSLLPCHRSSQPRLLFLQLQWASSRTIHPTIILQSITSLMTHLLPLSSSPVSTIRLLLLHSNSCKSRTISTSRKIIVRTILLLAELSSIKSAVLKAAKTIRLLHDNSQQLRSRKSWTYQPFQTMLHVVPAVTLSSVQRPPSTVQWDALASVAQYNKTITMSKGDQVCALGL